MSVPNFVLAVQARDAAAARAALAPTFKGKANGKDLDIDGQMRLLEAWWTGFPAANFAMSPVGGSGRYVITWTLFGIHDGFYAGIPGTGKTVSFSGFIVAVSDKTGILSLDWKWDPKVFTKVVLGPDDVGTLEVKDHFRADPSRRWAHGDPRRKGKGKKPKQAKAATPAATADGQAVGETGQPKPPRLGPDGQLLPPKRRRRGKGPKKEGVPSNAANDPAESTGAGTQTPDAPESTPSTTADESGSATSVPEKPEGA